MPPQSQIQYAYALNPNTGQPAYVYAGTGGLHGSLQPITLAQAQEAVRGGLQFSPNVARSPGVAMTREDLFAATENTPSGMVDSYKNPTTGEVMTNVPISQIQNLGNIPSNLGGTGAFKAAPNLGGASSPNVSFTSTPLPPTTPIQNNVPTGNNTYTSTPTSNIDTTKSYYQNFQNTLSTMQTAADTQRQQQLDKINADKATAQTALDTANANEDTAIKAEKQMILDRVNADQAAYDTNFNAVQGLIGAYQDYMAKGADLIAQQKGVTGLAAIRDPRVNQTINEITAKTASLKAGIDAYNGQLNQSRDHLVAATNSIVDAFKNQIAYYDRIAKAANDKEVTLTKDQQDFITATNKINQDNIDRVQKNSDALQTEFLDPTKALAFAKVGITLMTPIDQWGTLLAKQAYSEELSKEAELRANDGYTPLLTGNAPKGSVVVTVPDSRGINHTWWKAATAVAGATNPNELLSPTEAQTLGVPYGTTKGQAANMKIIPSDLSNSTKTMVEAAPNVVMFVDKVNKELDDAASGLGPAASRWREFTAGKIGLEDTAFTQIRTNVGLLTTLLMRMHVGARGGEYIMKHFQDLVDSSKQSPANLKAALSEIKDYANSVIAEGKGGTVGGQAPQKLLTPAEIPSGYYQASDGLLYKK
jgi:hypothetical protein